jgi:uncharacterized protein involved in exopolysaccharide biosynthesis
MAFESEQIVLEPEFRTAQPIPMNAGPAPNWVANVAILWDRRRTLARVAAISLVVSLIIAFVIPKRYESVARIMPPDSSGSGTAMLAALAGRGLGGGGDALGGGLGALAANLLGAHASTALYVDLLRSGTVTGALIDRFDLQHAYRKRYRVDTAKYLLRHTSVVDDKKSGVITLKVTDTDPTRARDLAQAYLDQLNLLLNRTSTSSAHRERVFVERRLVQVKEQLEQAQQELSNFSSTHDAIDIREQTRAMVDAGARLEGELIATQGEVQSLRQIYGDGNVRLRAAQARIADLKRELAKMSGTSAQLPQTKDGVQDNTKDAAPADELYPPLRQLPRLAVPYADLYRTVRVQEVVFELLTQQYEMVRIQEAKDIPVVSVIDSPGIPEKKSFPPRILTALLLTIFAICVTCAGMIAAYRWSRVDSADPRKQLADEIWSDVRARISSRRALQ